MRSTQPPQELNYALDFSGNCPPSAQEGMARADAHANPEWKREIDACVRAVALRQKELTVCDVRQEYEKTHTFTTHLLCALGPRMKEIAKTLGWIRPTDRVKRSTIEASHGNYHKVWDSNLHRGQQ